MVGGGEHVGETGEPGRVRAGAIAEQCVDIGLVEHRPVLDAIAQAAPDHARVVGKFLGGVALEPAALVLERLRQIPMIEA